LQKLGLEGKNQMMPQWVHIAEFKKKINSENVKNKECVHTWANSTSHIYYTLLWQVLGCGVQIQRPKAARASEREESAREKRHRRGAQGLDDLENPAAAADHHV
jgi:hypothetical protein